MKAPTRHCPLLALLLLAHLAACDSSEDPTGDPVESSDDLCATAEIDTGLVGVTNERTCDTDDDCVEPMQGTVVDVYDHNPQIGGDPHTPGTLEGGAVAQATASSDASGRFEIKLPDGSWFVCTSEPDETVLCSGPFVIEAATPLFSAYFETGNGPLWSVRSCDE